MDSSTIPQDKKYGSVVQRKKGRINRPFYMIGSAIQDPEMGKRVRYWREDMGFSLAEVAKRSGLPVDLIKSIEAGNHTRTDVIVKLADTLRCSIDFLLGCGGASVVQDLNKKTGNRERRVKS